MAGRVLPKVGFSRILSGDDDSRPQRLIADQLQAVWIDDRSRYFAAASIRTVTLNAIGVVNDCAALEVTRPGAITASC
jgi:hypothetical protein